MEKYLQIILDNFEILACKTEIRKSVKYQCCPTCEDINNTKELSSKLKSNDLSKTISNILEWEERNIQYWYERSDLLISSLLGIMLIAPLLILAFATNIMNNLFKLEIISKIDVLARIVSLLAIASLPGTLFFVLCYNQRKTDHFVTKNNIIGEKNKLNITTFKPSISINNILKYRLAVCRDYAKMSCALLASSQLDNVDDVDAMVDIYVVTLPPSHMACAVGENDTFYILDQRLPIKQIDSWLLEHHKTKANLYKLKVDKINKITDLEPAKLYSFSENFIENKQEIDCSYIEKEICKLFNIESNSKDGTEIKIRIDRYFDKCNINYYDDISRTSFVNLIKKKIDDELCSNTHNINSVEISADEKCINAHVYIS
jgi:predicted transglutaminase-like protease